MPRSRQALLSPRYIGTCCHSAACFSLGGWQGITGEFFSQSFTETEVYHYHPGFTGYGGQNQCIGFKYLNDSDCTMPCIFFFIYRKILVFTLTFQINSLLKAYCGQLHSLSLQAQEYSRIKNITPIYLETNNLITCNIYSIVFISCLKITVCFKNSQLSQKFHTI